MVGGEISYGFIFEVRLKLLEDPPLGTSEILRGAYLRAEFPERGLGVWSLG